MRKMILTAVAAATSFGLAMGAVQASASPALFKANQASLFAEDAAPRSEIRSALDSLLNDAIAIEVKAETTTTAAADPEAIKGECPEEAKAKKPAGKGSGEEKSTKKEPVGPEPIYFAF